VNGLKPPFPWFGGKRRAAAAVWAALGDPGGYTEPFAGSAAVLLARPRGAGRRAETLNDADGWLVNAWRSIQLSPAGVAAHAWGPVTEIDYHARLAWLQERRTPDLTAWLEGDPENHDPKAAGWWLYVLACGIGDPFGPGPWRVVDGHLRDTRKLPHLGDAGRGVNRELPHLGNAGQGVNRELPHLGNAGQGALTAYMQELAARLARVRITCGDWRRVLSPSAVRASAGNGTIGIFLDPPYSTGAGLYAESGEGTDQAVREWCTAAPRAYRIVLCGYGDDHDALLADGWRKEAGRSGGGAGYSADPRAGRRERLWLSPSCLGEDLFSASTEAS
jgi:hypothetical protein